jgi:hypothetical protein
MVEKVKVRTDFHAVNLSTGERTRSVVGDGERKDEVVGTMNAPSKLPGCTACDVTIDHAGTPIHDPGCPIVALDRHKNALHKIAGILKEVGIGALELGGEVLAGGSDKE